MNSPAKYLSAEARRAATVEAVIQLAAQTPPSEITTTAIAQHMGVTQGALFKHFPTKEAILEAVMVWVAEHLLSRVDEAAHAAQAHGGALAALEAIFLAHVDFVVEHPGVPRMLFGELQRSEMTAPKRVVQTLLGHYGARLQQWLAQGQAQGQDTMFGVAPTYAEINWKGLDFTAQQFATVTSIDKAAWVEEFKLHTEHFDKLAYHLPQALLDTKAALEKRLAA